MRARFLLVEDDESLGLTIKEVLEREGYKIEWARTRAQGAALLARSEKESSFDLLLLDIGLPDGSGLELARAARVKHKTPIIFLSVFGSAEARLQGFEIGAVDYIPKPFHLKELLIRVGRVLEQSRIEKDFVACAKCALDPGAMAVVFPGGGREFLAPRDFALLSLLIRESPAAVSRAVILQKLWPGDHDQSGRTVDNAIMRLRQVLRSAESDCIVSVRGVGYRWLENRISPDSGSH